MATTFNSPNNPLAAMWASAVELYVRKKNPGMPLQQARRLPMMQGLYEHLSQLEKQRSVEKPPFSPALSGEALSIAENAWLSQEYFNLAVTTAAFASIGDGSTAALIYTTYVGLLDSYNNSHGKADFSTDDLGGFALCVIVWLGMVGLNNAGQGERKILQYLESQLPAIPPTVMDLFNDFMALLVGHDFTIQYRDASNHPDYKAIPWQIPAGAQIVMLGDWGTSLEDAHAFLYAIWQQAYLNNPGGDIVFIHLGDIYYCGLPYECQNYFYDVFNTVGNDLQQLYGNTFNAYPPIFTLPGNHEYYSLGYGYFEMLDYLNTQVPHISQSQLQQQCSFFCLRTADDHWQFLGMDTGQADGNGLLSALQGAEGWVLDKINNMVGDVPDWLAWSEEMVSKLYEDCVGPFQPELRPNEVTWLQDRIAEFPGKTILLSHHQVFSREAKINHSSPEFMNTWLDKHFHNYYKNDIAAWYWGHEHTFAIYLDGLMGLNKGRLLGSSSYEATLDADTPYADNYPMVLFNSSVMDPPPIKSNDNGLYYHAGAVMAQNAKSSSEMDVTYYQFPAWTQLDQTPSDLKLDAFVSEKITTSFKSLKPNWIGNVPISQDNVTTDFAPSLTAWNDILYMLYADGTTKDPELTLCTGNAALASDYNSNTSIWSDKSTVLVGGDSIVITGSPVVVAVDEMLYGFYLDANSYINGIYCSTTGDLTSWTSFGDLNDAATGVAACFFQGFIHVVYVNSSNNLHWGYYDIATGAWTNQGKLTDTSGDDMQSSIAPALCADGARIYMIYKDHNSTDIHWALGEPSADVQQKDDYNVSWSVQGKVETTSNSGQSNPDTSIGMTMCYGSGAFFMVYASTNSDLTLCALDGADESSAGNWVGKNTIKPITSKSGNTSNAQTSQCPSMAVTSGGGFLVYRGATHDEIYCAYY